MTRRILILSLLTGVALGGCSAARAPAGGADAGAASAARPSGATAAQIAAVDTLMAQFTEGVPGAVVAIVRGGELAFARGYGMADLTHGVPFQMHTPVNIGSTAKQFTAFGTLLLAQRGQLSLDDDVRTHIPELPHLGATVRLRHLLTHTSGYREFVNLLMLGGRQVMEGDHLTRSEVIEVVQRQPRLQNEPGAEFNYNNTGYGLLATVIERVTGMGFDAWMAEEVFRPLGMNDTQVRLHPGQVVPGRAVGYLRDEGAFREVGDLGGAAGAGGVYTTVTDLARWLRNFRTGELGGPELIRSMTTPNVLTSGEVTPYGFGIMIDTLGGLLRWHHGGGDLAHRSHFYYFPELDAAYLVISNHAAFPPVIPQQIARVFFGEHLTPSPGAARPDEIAVHVVPGAVLDRYVGRFTLDPAPTFILEITREGDRLRARGPDQPAFDLRPVSDTTFAVPQYDIGITFHVDPDGTVRRLTLHQNGDHGATRIALEVAPEPMQYAGRYFSRELETFLTVTVDEGALTMRHHRYGPIRLSHSRGDRFAGQLPVSEAAFERDAAGRVTGFRVDAGGRARDVLFERAGEGWFSGRD
jgi:CubicO group peptidase (beta-lactamase class C family)